MFFVAVTSLICVAQSGMSGVSSTPQVAIASYPTGNPANSGNGPLKTDVDLVLVPVTVTDQLGRLVLGLETENFSVYDTSEQQAIRHFSREDAPISLGVIFDTSCSMYRKIERSRGAVVDFLRSANPEDEFFLIAFNDRPELLVDYTSSVDEIQNRLAKVTPTGNTALLDAVYLGLNMMRRAHNERRVLLILSDGGDNHSRFNFREVWSVVEESNVQIYAMGIFDESPRTKEERAGPSLLNAITSVTGGRTFVIDNLKELGDAASRLSTELRNQYVIAYRPSNLARDGRWHKISVRLAPPPNSPPLRVHAKAGYYAPLQR